MANNESFYSCKALQDNSRLDLYSKRDLTSTEGGSSLQLDQTSQVFERRDWRPNRPKFPLRHCPVREDKFQTHIGVQTCMPTGRSFISQFFETCQTTEKRASQGLNFPPSHHVPAITKHSWSAADQCDQKPGGQPHADGLFCIIAYSKQALTAWLGCSDEQMVLPQIPLSKLN